MKRLYTFNYPPSTKTGLPGFPKYRAKATIKVRPQKRGAIENLTVRYIG